jgi:pimeloyl-ACP methyl ester carboxylesterase
VSAPTRVALSGGRLELLDIPGDPAAAPLLLLHEGLGSVGLWRSFPLALAAETGRRTVVYSRYGHGYSDPPPKARTPAFMDEEAVDVVPELIDLLGLGVPLLIGHSDGATIALIYAAHNVARGVVALAPHVFIEEVNLQGLRRAREAYAGGDLRERMARRHRDPDAAFHGWNDVWLDRSFRDWDIRGLLHRISCPLLLIQGEHDQYGTMAQLDAIEASVRGSVTRVQLDCGHAPQLERPQETLDAVARFVRAR